MKTFVKDNRNIVIFNENDLVEEVGAYNSSLARLVQEMMYDLKKEADYTTRKINTDLVSYEGSLEENNSFFVELSESLERLDNLLSANRLNRKNILNEIRSIEKGLQQVY